MSITDTKRQLHAALLDTSNKVIALTGKWGTGKSHLWREVSNESECEVVRKSLYVSLFGLTDLSQVKIKIMQSAISDERTFARRLKEASGHVKNFLKEVHKGFSIVDELALMAAPSVLKGKFIVIDDIERKHEKLSIDEVLGFIDEFSQKYNSRFLIILNSDKLDKRAVWDALREKVIDQEMRLSTSAEQAFDIAVQLTPSLYAGYVKKAIVLCRINNIRIIRKIIKVVSLVLSSHENIPESVLVRVIPSTVLLAAISYGGIENGPDFNYVLSASELMWEGYLADESKLEDDGSKLRVEWKSLLESLRITRCDDYELLVVGFLESGLLNAQRISDVISGYIKEQERLRAIADVADFKFNFLWDHRINNDGLLARAQELVSTAKFIDAATVTELHGMLSEIPNGSEVGEEFVRQWIENFESNHQEAYENEHTVHTRIHESIQEAIKKVKQKNKTKLILMDACNYILKNQSWDSTHEIIMKRAGPMDFESVIVNMDPADLKDFMGFMIKVYREKEKYRTYFGEAGNNFYEACQTIISDSSFDRLSIIVRRAVESKLLQTNT